VEGIVFMNTVDSINFLPPEVENPKHEFINSLQKSMAEFERPEVRQFIIETAQEFKQLSMPYLKIDLTTKISSFINIPGVGNIHHGSLDCFSTVYLLLRKLQIRFPDFFGNLILSDRSQYMEPSTFEHAISQGLFVNHSCYKDYETATINRKCFFVFTQKAIGGSHLIVVVRDDENELYVIHNKNTKEGFVIEGLSELNKYLDFEGRKIYTM
jgi:hypothetical protein